VKNVLVGVGNWDYFGGGRKESHPEERAMLMREIRQRRLSPGGERRIV
jgi:hypothetical protein